MAKNPAQRSNQGNQLFATQQTLTHYEGAIPHPDILRGMDDLVPGTAARLIKLAEDESLHRRQLEVMAMEANVTAQHKQLDINCRQNRSVFRSDLIGQIAGFIVCVLSIVSAVFLGLEGHEWLAGTIAAIPTAAIIKAFTIKK
jgi:uncharacterized membrane protein